MSTSPARRPIARLVTRLLVAGLAVALIATLRELAFARNRAKYGRPTPGTRPT